MRLANKLNECIRESIVDGEGYRIVLFTQGCMHKCKGCHNSSTWDVNGGVDYSVTEIANYLLGIYQNGKGFFSGITISGGEPLLQKEELLQLMSILKKHEPNLNIWVYTGFEFLDVKHKFNDLIKYVDVFVTGKYVEKLNVNKFINKLDMNKYKFRGSINQKLIRLAK